MNKRDLIRQVAEVMRHDDIRKSVSVERKVFHISDDDGNHKDFVLKGIDRKVPYSIEDVKIIFDTCLYVIQEALKSGESVSIQGFGSFGIQYRKPRATKRFGDKAWIEIRGRYLPKFTFGKDLKLCAKLYELSLGDIQGYEGTGEKDVQDEGEEADG